ncbi:MAG TPA: recombinase RecA, partial [Parasutterella excrementihominis]|nr:recombinase RecA [Parasutterella excrementihominis]
MILQKRPGFRSKKITILRRIFEMKKVLAAVAVAMTLPMTVMAWEPTGDVNVIVAYKAGSGTDTGARLLATEAQKYIPKTIIIQNLPGADGKIGWTKLVQSKPD